MKLTLGQLLTNNTGRFLSPMLNTFNSSFQSNFKPIHKHILAYAVGDLRYNKAKHTEHKYLLFIVCNINGVFLTDKQRYLHIENGRKIFDNFLKYIKTSSYYYDDYILNSIGHCVVLQIPKDWYKVYDNFIKGEYSKMYSKVQVKAMFSNKDNIAVLTKDDDYRPMFVERLNKKFGTNLNVEDLPKDIELEIPPFEDDYISYENTKNITK